MSRRKIKYKKSFTLIEIIIVVIILSVASYLTLSNISFDVKDKKNNVSLMNLKERLLEFSFSDNITLQCIKEGEKCFVFIDNIKSENEIDGLFLSKPEVYKYDKNLDIIDYKILELEDMESYEIAFKYKIDKYNKSDDVIVKVANKIYIFNSIHSRPMVLENVSEVYDYFDNKIQKVKDAF